MRNRTVAIIGDSISLDHFLLSLAIRIGDSISLDHFLLSLSHLLGVPYALPKVMNRNVLLKSHVCNDMRNSGVISNDNGAASVSDNANDGSNRNAGSNQHSSITTSTLLGYITNEYFPDVLLLHQAAHTVPHVWR